MAALDDVCCAAVPEAALALLGDLRTRPGVRVRVEPAGAWALGGPGDEQAAGRLAGGLGPVRDRAGRRPGTPPGCAAADAAGRAALLGPDRPRAPRVQAGAAPGRERPARGAWPGGRRVG